MQMIGGSDSAGSRPPWVAAGMTVAGVASSAVLNVLAGGDGEQTRAGVAWAAAG